jgi:autotransporter-associated beta strand protein
MKTSITQSTLAWAAACAVVTASALQGQTVSIYTGASTTSDNWTVSTNWDTSFSPNAPDALAQFSQTVATDRINMLMSSSALTIPAVHEAAGLLFLDGFVANAGNFLIRNSSTTTAGKLRLHGFDTTINGNAATGLVANFSEQDIFFSTANSSFQIELAGSGHFHVENPDVQTQVFVGITETGGSHGIVKTGGGILRFGSESVGSNYTGGFVMEEGIVEWTNSGNNTANPFGTGALTLRGGTLRSTTDIARALNSSIVLDGGAMLGSEEEGLLGGINVNSWSGSLATTIISDSTLTIVQTTNWNQAISGDFGLTKDGAGTLVFHNTSGDFTYLGATNVAAGILMVNTNLTDSDLSVESGATLAFGTLSTTGQGIFGQTVTMASDSILSFRLNELSSFDSMVANGTVSLDGAKLGIDLGFAPAVNDVFLLIDNRSGTALSGQLFYGGQSLSEGTEFIVESGDFSQLFSISYAYNGDDLALTAIPEPSTWALFAGLVALGTIVTRRRVR